LVNDTTPSDVSPSRPRRALHYVRLALVVYLGVLLVLLLFENKLVYRATGPDDWTPPPSTEIRDVELTSCDGTKIHGWWCPAPNSPRALLFLHGNQGNLSLRGQSILKIREHLGVSVLIIDYPGYGKSSGSPSEIGCYNAADAAYEWLTEAQSVAPSNLIVWGVSLGGGVAVDLASRKPCGTLVLVKTFSTMPDVAAKLYPWIPVRWLMRNRFNSLDKIRDCRCPVFVAHGTTDELIPEALGRKLFEAANEPKEYFAMADAGHNDPLSSGMFDALKAFLRKN
jgi:uncharacterized protein